MIEARKQNYQSLQLQARMGSSTGRTPALTAGEEASSPEEKKSKDGQRRRPGFNFFGGKQDASERASAKYSGKGNGEAEKPSNEENDGSEESHSWWKRLMCL